MKTHKVRAAFAAGAGALLLLTAVIAAAAAREKHQPRNSPDAVPAAEITSDLTSTDTAPADTAQTDSATSTTAAADTTLTTAYTEPAVQKEPSADAADFVLLSEAVPDAILEMRYYTTYNFVGERIDGYESPCALLTREAAEALREVSDEMNQKGYRLKIYDAYRPQSAVDHFVRWADNTGDTRMKAFFYPELNKSVLFDSGYISRHSGHSRGSTVDLTLFDMLDGKDLDMGGTFDYFGARSHPDFNGISQEQYANRMLLRNAMTAHGFHGITTEWWHFTLNNEPYPDTFFNFPVSPDVLP
ncbi:MAG: M15 family metallopeptidase [Oscillospiraceae bacterium]|nr:M15 family metallopeptidase [Oscillospiraceae bacterium]